MKSFRAETAEKAKIAKKTCWAEWLSLPLILQESAATKFMKRLRRKGQALCDFCFLCGFCAKDFLPDYTLFAKCPWATDHQERAGGKSGQVA